VTSTWAAIEMLGLDARAVRARVAASGPGTAEALRAHGLQPDWCTQAYQADDVATHLAPQAGRGARILVPYVEAMPRLIQALTRSGVHVDAVAVADTQMDREEDCYRLSELLEPPGLDLVVLPASRAVDELANLLLATQRSFESARIVCIGPKTAERARAIGWHVDGVAERASRAALVTMAIQLLGDRVYA
jgi:uroporphyrinogen III methyltransferase/synthase